MKKHNLLRGVLLLLSVGIVALCVYLFFIPYAYIVRMESKHAPYAIYSFLKDDITNIQEEKNGIRFTYSPKHEDKNVEQLWKVVSNKNRSKISIRIEFKQHSLIEKLNILLFTSERLKTTLDELFKIQRKLISDGKSHRWASLITASLKASKCLCVSLESDIKDKPRLMNQYLDNLAFYAGNANKPPRVYIKSIDFIQQTFAFDFCFPVLKNQMKTPIPDEFNLKNQPKIGNHSIDFYGNYALTPRIWAKLQDSLQLLEKKLIFPIVEVFIDSPFSGKDDTEWHSKIYFTSTESL